MKITASLTEYWELMKIQSKMAKMFPSFAEQKEWLKKLRDIDSHITTAHNPSHILQFLLAVFQLPREVKGCIVEAGAYKGGSTAKISLAARHVARELYVFDSFHGLPDNDELHTQSTLGHSIDGWFRGGNFSGSLNEVRDNIAAWGDLPVCKFVEGWFDDTMPAFREPVALAYLDVDLAASTKTCLKYLYPLISPGGAIYSQDGDFPLVIEVFKDERFWIEEVGCTRMPAIKNLGKKLTIIRK